MAVFPDSPRPIVPYEWHFDFATIASKNSESGKTQSRTGRSNDLLYATLLFPIRPIADYASLRAFCRWAQGMNRRFTFRDFNGTASSYTNPPLSPWPVDASLGFAGAGALACTKPSDGTFAVGDGATQAFDLPFSNTSVIGNVSVYDNGALLTPTTQWTYGSGTGVDGRDRATLVSPLALGHTLTASCVTGRLTIYARLATDSFSGKTLVGGGAPIQPTVTIMQDP